MFTFVTSSLFLILIKFVANNVFMFIFCFVHHYTAEPFLKKNNNTVGPGQMARTHTVLFSDWKQKHANNWNVAYKQHTNWGKV